MARSRTIKELEDMIRWQSDQEEAELRHTSADLRRAMNQSIQRYRERISANGHAYFLESHSGQLTPGAARDPHGTNTKYAWGLLDISSLSPQVVRIYGLDITSHQVITELECVEFSQRNYFQWGVDDTDIPTAFFGYDEFKIGILPPPDHGYQYTLWYLPLQEDLLEDDDEFNPGLPGGEQWIVWDVMSKLLVRDNYPRLIAAAQAEREAIMVDLLQRASSHSRVGSVKRIDTRNRAMMKRDYMFRSWRGAPGGPS